MFKKDDEIIRIADNRRYIVKKNPNTHIFLRKDDLQPRVAETPTAELEVGSCDIGYLLEEVHTGAIASYNRRIVESGVFKKVGDDGDCSAYKDYLTTLEDCFVGVSRSLGDVIRGNRVTHDQVIALSGIGNDVEKLLNKLGILICH
jgi:hypothetical protein